MAKVLLQTDPDRADYRKIRQILQTHFKKKRIETDPVAFDKVSSVFEKMGGSWKDLFGGGMDAFDLLKRILKVAIKTGVLTPSKKVE